MWKATNDPDHPFKIQIPETNNLERQTIATIAGIIPPPHQINLQK